MNEFITIANQFGLSIAILLGILASGAAGAWVWGWSYRDVVKQRDEWKEIAQKGQISSERMLELLDRRGGQR